MSRATVQLGLALLLSGTTAFGNQAAGPAQVTAPNLTLTDEQRDAVGIHVAQPQRMRVPDHINALGTVLDATQWLSERAELHNAMATEHFAALEVARLRTLYQGGAAASQKAVQAAELEFTKAQAQVQTAQAQFVLHWGPLAALTASQSQALSVSLRASRALLLRAEVLGQHVLGEVPAKAILKVDGLALPGEVLGVLAPTADTQSVAVLVEIHHPPQGLGPGARLETQLLTPARDGVLLPREAILYGAQGAYVYQALPHKSAGQVQAAKVTRYQAAQVKLLLETEAGWLVGGVDEEDSVVIHGAGVLWSLQDSDHLAAADDD